jgi:hypothetical protein
MGQLKGLRRSPFNSAYVCPESGVEVEVEGSNSGGVDMYEMNELSLRSKKTLLKGSLTRFNEDRVHSLSFHRSLIVWRNLQRSTLRPFRNQ